MMPTVVRIGRSLRSASLPCSNTADVRVVKFPSPVAALSFGPPGSAVNGRSGLRGADAERGSIARTLKAQLRIAQRIGAALGFSDVSDPLEPAEGMPLLADAESHRATEWESVLLVGDAATITAARRWHETIWTIELLIREGPVDEEMWTRAHRLASEARDSFYASARGDLGINGAPPPPGQWPREWRAELTG
jgi:nucleotide-binding universal stress UspA family protein